MTLAEVTATVADILAMGPSPLPNTTNSTSRTMSGMSERAMLGHWSSGRPGMVMPTPSSKRWPFLVAQRSRK